MKFSSLTNVTSALFFFLVASANVMATSSDDQKPILELQSQWAQIKYQLAEEEQEAALKKLRVIADKSAQQHPDSADILIWRGIVLSTYAGAKGGLGALGLADEARDSFEKALAINPDALAGSAYTSLGALYYQVPGWPLSFGSDKKAEELLIKALKIDPNGIDANFFYADFLVSQYGYDQAREVLNHALEAKPRPNRPLADQGRRAEIELLLEKIKGKHTS